MPIFRYFMFVGGALLALLFAADFVWPTSPVAQAVAGASYDQPLIRIRSDRHLPDRVVLDTSQPTIAAPVVKTAAVAAPQPTAQADPLADMSAKARVRETFAQFTPKADAAVARRLMPSRKLRLRWPRPRSAGSGPGSAQAQGGPGASGAAAWPADDAGGTAAAFRSFQHDLVTARLCPASIKAGRAFYCPTSLLIRTDPNVAGQLACQPMSAALRFVAQDRGPGARSSAG